MPRRKQALIQKKREQARLEAEKQKIEQQKKKLVEQHRAKQAERKRVQAERIRTWDKKYRPRAGQHVVYIERGQDNGTPYEDYFLGPIVRADLDDESGRCTFDARFRNYGNHREGTCPSARINVLEEGRFQYVSFNERDLRPSRKQSTCYTDVFVHHLYHDPEYVKLVMKTYYLARTNVQFQEKRCRDGQRCTKKNVGHLLHFAH